MTTKYKYYKVLQQNWGGSWEDIAYHETNSQFIFNSPEERKEYKREVNDYKVNQPKVPLRTINRKESQKVTN